MGRLICQTLLETGRIKMIQDAHEAIRPTFDSAPTNMLNDERSY